MAKLTDGRRKALPSSSFGEPGKRAYPSQIKTPNAQCQGLRLADGVGWQCYACALRRGLTLPKANRILGKKGK